MKKSILYSIIAIVLLISFNTFVGCNSVAEDKYTALQSEYDSYVTATELRFDSIDARVDSLTTILSQEQEKNQVLSEENEKLSNSNKNLSNVIKHQNTMINNLRK